VNAYGIIAIVLAALSVIMWATSFLFED